MDQQHHHDQHPSSTTTTTELKRKRSPSPPAAHLNKTPKTHNHLQINYLARQYQEDLPLISNDDTLPSILSMLGEYQGVLDRHESMACNLGARPLGPILIKRFERLFDGPPRVLKSHGKEGTTVTWLDVVEFARNKPEQFALGQMSEGLRVCQFYTKQCRVQISEEDFVLISSGIPQKMIPPQPIVEDEEKELGTLEILEKNLGQICQLADQVAARTRQLNHRLKGRKQAILDRRATNNPAAVRASSPSNVALMNGFSPNNAALVALAQSAQSAQAPTAGFVAVNSRPPLDSNGSSAEHGKNGASPATRTELLNKFSTVKDRATSNGDHVRRASSASRQAVPAAPGSATKGYTTPQSNNANTVSGFNNNLPPSDTTDLAHHLLYPSASPVPVSSTPAPLGGIAHAGAPRPSASTTQQLSSSADKDDGGPFKSEMVARMESLGKGERILPPCDRCRRLHMDCLKNLTACMGCTKKHAKCSWREVREAEVRLSGADHDDLDLGGYEKALLGRGLHSPASNSPSAPGSTSGHGSGPREREQGNGPAPEARMEGLALALSNAQNQADLSRHGSVAGAGGTGSERLLDERARDEGQGQVQGQGQGHFYAQQSLAEHGAEMRMDVDAPSQGQGHAGGGGEDGSSSGRGIEQAQAQVQVQAREQQQQQQQTPHHHADLQGLVA